MNKDLETIKKIVLEETITLSQMQSTDEDIKVEIMKSNAITNSAKAYLNAVNTEIKLEDAKKNIKEVF